MLIRYVSRALVLGSSLLASAAYAGDGVLEINQTCATETGCFPGDSAGFPVTVNVGTGSSFRLTSDLALPNSDTTAIQIGCGSHSSSQVPGAVALRGEG